MGEVVEVGTRRQRTSSVGDRVVVPFTDRVRQLLLLPAASCTRCCDNSNPERLDGREALRLLAARASSATRTCSAAMPAARRSTRACRSPTSDRSRCPTHLTDEQVLFLSDIFPTGYMAAENCNIQPGDTVAVWGCGPVGQFAIKSAFLLGAERVIAIDRRAGAAARWPRRTARPRR